MVKRCGPLRRVLQVHEVMASQCVSECKLLGHYELVAATGEGGHNHEGRFTIIHFVHMVNCMPWDVNNETLKD